MFTDTTWKMVAMRAHRGKSGYQLFFLPSRKQPRYTKDATAEQSRVEETRRTITAVTTTFPGSLKDGMLALPFFIVLLSLNFLGFGLGGAFLAVSAVLVFRRHSDTREERAWRIGGAFSQ